MVVLKSNMFSAQPDCLRYIRVRNLTPAKKIVLDLLSVSADMTLNVPYV